VGVGWAVCKKRGCWIQVSDPDSGKGIRIKVEDGVIVFPLESMGHRASAQGAFTAILLDRQAVCRGFRIRRWNALFHHALPTLPGPMPAVQAMPDPQDQVDYVNAGRLTLDPTFNPRPVTYHDPCNLSRSAGITGEPRVLCQEAPRRPSGRPVPC